jgi:hypothetical protein
VAEVVEHGVQIPVLLKIPRKNKNDRKTRVLLLSIAASIKFI